MNLLIVDDEEITRDGLMSSIDWASLDIRNIYQADDGINGLALARKYRPQIILSDVRMPRMNGIEMAGKIREELPDCHIIFMSGYSDKEYLKAAIRLKAISYVEKPILPKEVEDAVREAISTDAVQQLSRDSATRQIREAESKLALDITHQPGEGARDTEKRFAELHLSVRPATSFTTVIIRFVDGVSGTGNPQREEFRDFFGKLAEGRRLQYIWAVKQDEYLICHLISPERPSPSAVTHILSALAEQLSKEECRFYIAVGKTVTGADKAYESYNDAVILLQSAFFYEYGSILRASGEHTEPLRFPADIFAEFRDALASRDRENAVRIVRDLYSKLVGSQGVLVNYVKDLYYKLFMELFRTAARLQVHISESDGDSETILDYIFKSGTLTILHNMLVGKIDMFFRSLETNTQDSSTIYLIKSFISKNYQNVNLSVKDISDHVFLSTTYVCTIFKNATGKTLNQYLTEYRIERAKGLLADPRYKINDISEKVGYSDGNYFGKTFKKMVGLSPSEYREKNAK